MLIGELEACMLGNQSRFVVHILRRGISLMSQKRKALMIPSKLDSISLTKTYLFQFPPSLRLTYQLFVTHCSVLLVYIRISFSIVIFYWLDKLRLRLLESIKMTLSTWFLFWRGVRSGVQLSCTEIDWFHAKESRETLKNQNRQFYFVNLAPDHQKWPKKLCTKSRFALEFFLNVWYILDGTWWIPMFKRFRICVAKRGRGYVRPSYGQPKFTLFSKKREANLRC